MAIFYNVKFERLYIIHTRTAPTNLAPRGIEISVCSKCEMQFFTRNRIRSKCVLLPSQHTL